MGNNPSTEAANILAVQTIVYSSDAKIADLMVRSLESVGCQGVEVFCDVEATFEAIDRILPGLVFIIASAAGDAEWENAHRINKKRAINGQRTPKVLGLIKPSADDLIKAKKDGFFDIIPLPIPSGALAGRIETIISRLN